MQNTREVASMVVAASFTVLMVSAFILPSLATSAFAQDGAGVCRNGFNGPCGTNANPCSNKPGTISWPSSGGCVPPFCPAGGNKEVRGARLNSGECDPNFNSGSGGNKNTNSGIVPPCIIIPCTAGGAGSSTYPELVQQELLEAVPMLLLLLLVLLVLLAFRLQRVLEGDLGDCQLVDSPGVWGATGPWGYIRGAWWTSSWCCRRSCNSIACCCYCFGSGCCWSLDWMWWRVLLAEEELDAS